MRWISGLLSLSICLTLANSASAGGRRELIEVTVDDKPYQGRVVAHDKRQFWLLERDGQLKTWPIRDASSFRKVGNVFRGESAANIRDGLRKEFGRDYEVAGTTYYLVVAPKGRAKVFAELFDTTYRKFSSYCATRGFHLKRPPFPMVAIVFGSQAEFIKYGRNDGVAVTYGILGYYHRRTNRVALFDRGGRISANRSRYAGSNRNAIIASAVRNVIVHEATHQAAFNTGLHTRIGTTPKWVIEGLATVFEAPGIRNRTGKRGAKSRINGGRLRDFQAINLKHRKGRSLATFIANDRAFNRPTTAYAEAWALSFFLIERKSRSYSHYLKILTERDPLKSYTSRDRIVDFQKAFGNDLDRLEVEYLRFIKSLD